MTPRVTRVTNTSDGPLTFSIEGLTAGQLAYLVGLVGNSHSMIDARGRSGAAVVEDAHELWPVLRDGAEMADVHRLADAVSRSQELWRRHTHETEGKRGTEVAS